MLRARHKGHRDLEGRAGWAQGCTGMLSWRLRDAQRALGCAWKVLVAPITFHCHHGASSTAQIPLPGAQAPSPLAFLPLQPQNSQHSLISAPTSQDSLPSLALLIPVGSFLSWHSCRAALCPSPAQTPAVGAQR